MEKNSDKPEASAADQQDAAATKTTNKKPERIAGRQKMTLEECERLGLDPRPYGLLAKTAKK